MSRRLRYGGMFLGALAVVALVVLWAYYFGVWPSADLEVDDPEITAWLAKDSVKVHQRGNESNLVDTRTYIQQGQLVGGSCRWTTRLSMPEGRASDVRVDRTLAVDRTTCEKLVLEGTESN